MGSRSSNTSYTNSFDSDNSLEDNRTRSMKSASEINSPYGRTSMRKPKRLNRPVSNLSMIDENPSFTNHYKSSSFVMTSRSDPSLSTKHHCHLNNRTYASLNHHHHAYEVPIRENLGRNYYRRFSSEHPYLITHPFEIDRRHLLEDNFGNLYFMNDINGQHDGFYYNMPPILSYNNLYLAFLY